jgi:predicted DNA-binding transcriptional regulator AlpA
MMKRKTAAEYLDMSEAAFEREVISGRMPPPCKIGGREHWRKDAIDKALDMLTGQREDDVPEYRRRLRERYGKAA